MRQLSVWNSVSIYCMNTKQAFLLVFIALLKVIILQDDLEHRKKGLVVIGTKQYKEIKDCKESEWYLICKRMVHKHKHLK